VQWSVDKVCGHVGKAARKLGTQLYIMDSRNRFALAACGFADRGCARQNFRRPCSPEVHKCYPQAQGSWMGVALLE